MRIDSQGPEGLRPVSIIPDAADFAEVSMLIPPGKPRLHILAAQRVALEGDHASVR